MCFDLNNFFEKLENGDLDINESIIMQENEKLVKVKEKGAHIIWTLYTGLRRARMVLKDEEFKEDKWELEADGEGEDNQITEDLTTFVEAEKNNDSARNNRKR